MGRSIWAFPSVWTVRKFGSEMRKLVVYLAHRIRDPRGPWYVEEHIRAAEKVSLQLWQMGFAVITPGSGTRWFESVVPVETLLQGDLEILRRCDLVVTAPGWEPSLGVVGELKEAHKVNIPIYHYPECVPELRRKVRELCS